MKCFRVFRHFNPWTVCIGLLMFITSCGGEEIPTIQQPPIVTQPIVGGSFANSNQFPWQVALFITIDTNTERFCGGSILNQDWVLTAAHCVEGINATNIQVYSGSRSLYSGGNRTNVVNVIVHENYNPGLVNNDIALLQLASPLSLNGTSQLAIVPAWNADEIAFAQTGTLATVSGWGTISENGPVENSLRFVDVPIVNRLICTEAYAYGHIVTENMICAGLPEGGIDSCQGDSGGALVVIDSEGNYIQVGIVSWGVGCGRLNAYGVYTRVSKYADWIIRNCCSTGAGLFLSNQIEFSPRDSWTTAGYGYAPNGWYIGDFNGDMKDDLMRYCQTNNPCGTIVSGAEVFLSTGSAFESAGSWTTAGYGYAPNGWYVGNFDGQPGFDIFRYIPRWTP